MACVTYKEHQMYPLSKTPNIFVLRTQGLERLDVRTYVFMLDTDPTLWKQFGTKKIGEICHTFLGATPKDASSDESNGVAFLKTKNVYKDFLDLSDIDYITEQAHKKRKSSSLKSGDILMTIIGASFEVIGRCLVYRNLPDQANINQNIIGIRIRDEFELNPDFLCLQLNTTYGQMQVGQKAQRTAQFSLNKGLIEDFDVVIPDVDDQEVILDRYKSILEANRSLNDKVENLVLEMYKKVELEVDVVFASELELENFVRQQNQLVFLKKPSLVERLDNHSNHPDYTRLIDQIANCEKAGRLGDLVEAINRRFDPAQHQGELISYLAIGDIDGISGMIITPQILLSEDLPTRARLLIKEGDILLGSVSQGDQKTVVSVMGKQHDGWVASTGFIVLRPKRGVQAEYIARLLKSPFVLRQYKALISGSSMPTISEQDVLNFSVPVSYDPSRERSLLTVNNKLYTVEKLADECTGLLKQSNDLLLEAKSNIFDLLDDDKFAVISTKSKQINTAMCKIEEALQ